MKKDVQVGVRMTSELRNRLRELAAADRRTLAAYITLVLLAHADHVSGPPHTPTARSTAAGRPKRQK
jgi:hypothetical protein